MTNSTNTDAPVKQAKYQFDAEQMSPAAIQITSQNGNDERGTPISFIRKLHDAIGGLFDLDPCSGAEPQPIAHTRFDKEDNGLAQDWRGYSTAYVNPPYSQLMKWLQKIEREANREDPAAPDLILCLLPGNTSTQWFQQYATKAEYLCLIEGRLTFNGTDNDAPFASILVAFGDPDEAVLQTMDQLGAVYTRTEIEEADRQARLDELIQTDGGMAVPATPSRTNDDYNTQSPSGPMSLPQILDLSRYAPAVPQGVIDFYNIGIQDEFFIELDTSTLGFPEEAPTDAHVTVISGEAAGTHHSLTPDEWHTITCYEEASETWFVLCQDPNDLYDIRCSISIGGADWIDVDIETLHRLTASTKAALEPYGEGTSYVC